MLFSFEGGWGRYIISNVNLTYTRSHLRAGDNEEEKVPDPMPHATTVSVLVITGSG